MMNEKELMQKFDELYQKMSKSTNTDDMKLFGHVMREAIAYIAANRPDKADELLEELCAINWDNYLTKKEADAIVKNMLPAVRWNEEQVIRSLSAMGYDVEEAPYYNSHALFATISMKYSDSAATIAERAFKMRLDEMNENELLDICYHLALDVLKDKDGIFNIRKYFGLQ